MGIFAATAQQQNPITPTGSGGIFAQTAQKQGIATPSQPSATSQLLSTVGNGLGVGVGGVSPVSAVGLLKYAGNSIKNAFTSGVNQVKQGFQQTQNNPSTIGGLEGGVNETAGIVNMVASPLAPLFAPVGDAVNVVANKISDIPAVQKFATSNAGQTTARVVQDVSNVNTLAGTGVAATDIVPKVQSVLPKVTDFVANTLKDGQPINPELTGKPIVPSSPDSPIIESYNRAIKPTIAGKTGTGQMEAYNNNVVSAVKSIASNKDNLSFVNDSGETSTAELPKTRSEFADAVAQTKQSIYKQYNDLSTKATGQGVQIPLEPVANDLQFVVDSEALKISNPRAISYAQGIIERLKNSDGSYKSIDPTVTEDVIKNYNASLKAFYRNPSYDSATNAAIDAGVVHTLRGVMDEQINNATGENYQALKNQYGALSAIEKDANKAAITQAKQSGIGVSGLGKYIDVFSGGDMVSGLLSLNPALFAKGIAQSTIAHFFQWFNSPDRAIGTMFKNVSKTSLPK